MALIERSATIAAPIDCVYRASQDYAVRYEWDPFPERIHVVSGSPDDLKVGTQVHVASKLGMHMRVEFVQVSPPTRTAVKMIEGPWALSKFAGSWIFEALDARTTAARFRYALVTRPAWLRGVMEPVASLYFSRVVEKRLQGLKAYCERAID